MAKKETTEQTVKPSRRNKQKGLVCDNLSFAAAE